MKRDLYIKDWLCTVWIMTEETSVVDPLLQLDLLGAAEESKENVVNLFAQNEYNHGFLYIDFISKTAVLIVGQTTDGEQFLNTFIHEITHLTGMLAQEYSYDMSGEKIAYLMGDSIMQLSDVLCKYSCSRCRRC